MTASLVSSTDIIRFLPEIILTVMGTALMVLDPVLHKRSSYAFGHLAIAALIAGIGGAIYSFTNPGPAFGGMLVVDGFATFFRILVMSVGILAILPSYSFLARQEAETSEYHALLLFSIAGQCLMAAANDLIIVFIGLEISSIASYVLAGYLRDDKRANESSLKYFLLGSFATAFFLYGVAIVYGTTGTVNLTAVRNAVAGQEQPLVVFLGLAAALMFVGLGFKVSAAPFQIWAPDVYQGAPTPVSAFLSAGPKAAAFAVFLRIFLTAFGPIGAGWEPLVWLAALLSMTVGNFAALLQTNVKRMLGYSSIAHAGYVLVALTARSEIGTAAAMFYLAGYAFMNIGAFSVVSHL
jgi:NADH-quinone oxidoreductase subunit N